jgi:hypothetical protein
MLREVWRRGGAIKAQQQAMASSQALRARGTLEDALRAADKQGRRGAMCRLIGARSRTGVMTSAVMHEPSLDEQQVHPVALAGEWVTASARLRALCLARSQRPPSSPCIPG